MHPCVRALAELIEVGADECLKNIDLIAGDQISSNILRKSYMLAKYSVEDVAEDLFAIGLIDKPINPKKIQQLKKGSKKGDPFEYTFRVLENSGVFLTFSAESRDAPVKYDNFIKRFIDNSNSKLPLSKISVEVNGDIEIDYRITLEANNKTYLAQPEDVGYYDVDCIVTFLNDVLKDAGIAERYKVISTAQDDFPQVFFGTEDKINKFLEKYRLIYSD